MEQLTLFPEGSRNHANPTQQPESGSEKKMNATSGQKCLEQFGKLGHVGSWAKTFADLLVGTGDWYSMRCNLTWKLRATKSSRSYFQLAPSTLPTEGKGSGLLPTPVVMDTNCGNLEKIDERRAKAKSKGYNGNGFCMTVGEMANRGLLPTPQSRDFRSVTGNEVNQRDNAMQNLNVAAYEISKAMLPTPATRDYKGARSTEALEAAGRSGTNSLPDFFNQTGISSQLNPLFVGEMMGFPPNWLELPFLNTGLRA